MLSDSKVTANVPAADLDRARQLLRRQARPHPGAGGRRRRSIYTTAGGTTFFLYQTEFAGQAGHTIAQWHVADIDGEVRELKDKGVTFEHYDMPGVDLGRRHRDDPRDGSRRLVQGQRGQHHVHRRHGGRLSQSSSVEECTGRSSSRP